MNLTNFSDCSCEQCKLAAKNGELLLSEEEARKVSEIKQKAENPDFGGEGDISF